MLLMENGAFVGAIASMKSLDWKSIGGVKVGKAFFKSVR